MYGSYYTLCFATEGNYVFIGIELRVYYVG